MTHPETVIYDEVDVYYKTVALDQFHRFFSTHLFNLKANCVLFASATMQESVLNITDTNLARPLMLTQLFNIRQQVANDYASKYRIITPTSVYTAVDIAGASQLIPLLWQGDKTYIYFDLHVDVFNFATYQNGEVIVYTKENRTAYPIADFSQAITDLLMLHNVLFVTNRKLRFLPFLHLNDEYPNRLIYTVNEFRSY